MAPPITPRGADWPEMVRLREATRSQIAEMDGRVARHEPSRSRMMLWRRDSWMWSEPGGESARHPRRV